MLWYKKFPYASGIWVFNDFIELDIGQQINEVNTPEKMADKNIYKFSFAIRFFNLNLLI